MSNIIRVKIDVTKIEKARLYKGEKGTYLNCVLIPTENSRFDQTHMVVQDVSKEEREAGKKGPIIGNATEVEPRGSRRPDTAAKPASKPAQTDEDDVPF